jgi:hypothetical protein
LDLGSDIFIDPLEVLSETVGIHPLQTFVQNGILPFTDYPSEKEVLVEQRELAATMEAALVLLPQVLFGLLY